MLHCEEELEAVFSMRIRFAFRLANTFETELLTFLFPKLILTKLFYYKNNTSSLQKKKKKTTPRKCRIAKMN